MGKVIQFPDKKVEIKPQPENEMTARIKVSLDRINVLMAELKKMSQKEEYNNVRPTER